MKKTLFVSVLLASGLLCAAGRDFKPLTAGRPRPADFDAYWDGEVERQRREVPLDAAKVMVTNVLHAKAGFRVMDVAIPALSERPATGILAIPAQAQAKSLPIIVTACGAGTRNLSPVCYSKAIGFIISPYGEPPFASKEYYDEAFRTTLKDYMHRGWTDRETCWFHGQVLRMVRALEWLKTLPEWNGRDLIVEGVSMGGSQSIQAAALDKDVTVCAPRDPALCDHAGELAAAPRRPGWPQIAAWSRNQKMSDEEQQAVLRTSDYYDNCNFASRIRCRSFFTSGYCDIACPSEGVYRAYSAVQGDKVLTVDPEAKHCGTKNRPFQQLMERYR